MSRTYKITGQDKDGVFISSSDSITGGAICRVFTKHASQHDLNIIHKAPKMYELLEKVCSELYRTDNSMATEVKQLLTELNPQ